MQLVLDTNGIIVKKRNKCFYITTQKQSRLISPHKLTSIAVLADCLLSASVIRLAAQHEIPILFFNRSGKVESRLWSPKFGSIATIRRHQVLFTNSHEATDWVIDLFQLKTAHQIQNLDFLINRKKGLADILKADKKDILRLSESMDKHRHKKLEVVRSTLMGLEGSIARTYWEAISKTLPEPFTFTARSRRPAKDFFNAALNYYYGMLYSQVEGALFAGGLDPYLGVFHADEYNKPTLVFDMIEPFRPWIDRLLIEACLGKKITPDFFQQKKAGFWISKVGKQFIIPSFNDWAEKRRLFDHKRLSNKNHLHRFAGLFAQKIQTL